MKYDTCYASSMLQTQLGPKLFQVAQLFPDLSQLVLLMRKKDEDSMNALAFRSG